MFGHDNNDGQQQNNNAPVTAPAEPAITYEPPDNEDTSAPAVVEPISDVSPVISPPPTDDQEDATEVAATSTPEDQEDLLPAHSSDTDELLDIKQEALQQLSPLVGHLDQTPEEKFKTTMMMIQASDDQTLVKIAYDAAKQIADEKEKAQALLDIVNEINYFTQQSNK